MKKGFTLIEILGTLVVLAAISLITIPTISNVITESRHKAYEEQLTELYSATKLYLLDKNIILDVNAKSYVLIAQLVESGYLKAIPDDPRNNDSLNGVVLATGTLTGTSYEYLDDLSSETNIVRLTTAYNNIVIKANSSATVSNLFKETALASSSLTIKTLNNKKVAVGSTAEFASAFTNYLANTFSTNTAYHITFQVRSIAATNTTSNYNLNFIIYYTDGTNSGNLVAGTYNNKEFTTFSTTSDATKTIASLGFVNDSDSPFDYAVALDSFTLTPNIKPSPTNNYEVSSLGDDGYMHLVLIKSDNTTTYADIPLTDTLNGIIDTNIADAISIDNSGNISLTKNVGVVVLDGSEAWVSENTTNGIDYYLPLTNSVTTSDLTSIKSLLTHFPLGTTSSSNNVYSIANSRLYVSKAGETLATYKNWLASQSQTPVTLYYQLATPSTTSLTATIDLTDVKYLYVNTNQNITITLN